MKAIITVFISLLLAVWFGSLIQQDPGYLLLAYRNWTVEMPLWIGVVVMGLVFFMLYLAIRSVKYIGSLNTRWQRWREKRRVARSHSRTSQGVMAFTEGHWSVAEKLFVKALPYSDSPLINYLAAARAAQAQSASERREQYLRDALKAMPDAKLSIQLTRAQLQLANHQYTEAGSTLTHLYTQAPKHPLVLKLLHELYLKQSDWTNLYILLPELRRQKVLPPAEFEQVSSLTYRGLLQLAASEPESTALEATWKKLPHQDPKLIATYVKLLHHYHQHNAAEQVLQPYIKKHWDETLISLYGKTHSEQPSTQLGVLESWLKQYPNNAELLLAAGRICLQRQLWGKARTYFENSLSIAPRAEVYAELADLLTRLGETPRATDYYRRGLVQTLVPIGK